EDGRSVFQVTALDLGLAVAVTQLGAVEVLAQDDVDHAADGVGAVHRRSAVGQDLDALDRGQRDGVDVGARGGRHRVGRGATAVDQHEGTAGAEAAQVDRRQRLGRAARLRLEVAEGGEGGITQDVRDGDVTGGIDRCAV